MQIKLEPDPHLAESAYAPSPEEDGIEYGRTLANHGERFPTNLVGNQYASQLGYTQKQWRKFKLGMIKGYDAALKKRARTTRQNNAPR